MTGLVSVGYCVSVTLTVVGACTVDSVCRSVAFVVAACVTLNILVSTGVGTIVSACGFGADDVEVVCVEVSTVVVGEISRSGDEGSSDVAIVALGSGLVHAPVSTEVTEGVGAV